MDCLFQFIPCKIDQDPGQPGPEPFGIFQPMDVLIAFENRGTNQIQSVLLIFNLEERHFI